MTEQAASVSVPGNASESLDKQLASPEHDFDGSDGSDDELSELIDMSFGTRQDGAAYCETMETHVNTIQDFCDGLMGWSTKYNLKTRDSWTC